MAVNILTSAFVRKNKAKTVHCVKLPHNGL